MHDGRLKERIITPKTRDSLIVASTISTSASGSTQRRDAASAAATNAQNDVGLGKARQSRAGRWPGAESERATMTK